ncbi:MULTISPECIES: helix-turn-helix domain-containing protein [Myroides]|uniref:Helix-turn-helix domain-containing protein n=1 Tax=Myroides albus TaxID=2562892 RepID=A0A6I3LLQ0_9FLAO|nr:MULTISPECIES: helix-turn-helix transcriptional regulator [Myroides]MTG96905.1 helix-turn-helix domain-containing protein [Myroides albus]MVX34744.1 helix-turn-helix domain-containing protein [Myroides sp. LoEW2-1]UVD78345.1 helix-turn-helix transcriptional regulator [Myroides albus]
METDKIKSRRKSLGFSQEYVAMKLGISQKAYSDIESGKTKLKTEVLNEIAVILEISPYSVCPISCDCTRDLERKHSDLVSYLVEKGIDIPKEYM